LLLWTGLKMYDFYASTSVTRSVREKVAQNVAQSFLAKVIHNFYCGRELPNYLRFFCNFQKNTQSKKSPNRRKFAQSGRLASTNAHRFSNFVFVCPTCFSAIQKNRLVRRNAFFNNSEVPYFDCKSCSGFFLFWHSKELPSSLPIKKWYSIYICCRSLKECRGILHKGAWGQNTCIKNLFI
jgi:hypothetical protein